MPSRCPPPSSPSASSTRDPTPPAPRAAPPTTGSPPPSAPASTAPSRSPTPSPPRPRAPPTTASPPSPGPCRPPRAWPPPGSRSSLPTSTPSAGRSPPPPPPPTPPPPTSSTGCAARPCPPRPPGDTVHVGGTPAAQADLNDRLARRMPLVVGFVLAIAGLLLLLAFRAPVVAVKAAVMNLVSVGAAYGVLTAVFQQGHGAGLLGLDGPVPIPGYVPLLMFAVLFGLSMDYEVFLLTAVRTAYLRHRDNRRAVVEGLGGTGRIISSAALIMVSVFLSYLLSDDPVVKMFGIGLATAVALDATVVRGILVPSTMVLLGRGNWWLPRRLDALLPHIDIEGDGTEEPTAEAAEPVATEPAAAAPGAAESAAAERTDAEQTALPTAAGAP
ncbi:MMPL family transporter [Kitasatospora arboriphila]